MPRKGKEEPKVPPRQEILRIKGLQLLNSVKVQKALDIIGEAGTEEDLLAQYDKLGGAIKKGERKLSTGTFWDFENRCAKSNVDLDKLGEEAFVDKYILVRKPVQKKTDVKDVKSRLAKVKRGRPKKEEAPKEADKPKSKAKK